MTPFQSVIKHQDALWKAHSAVVTHNVKYGVIRRIIETYLKAIKDNENQIQQG